MYNNIHLSYDVINILYSKMKEENSPETSKVGSSRNSLKDRSMSSSKLSKAKQSNN